MAVAYVSTKSAAPASGSTFTSASWVTAGTNPVILIYVATNDTTALGAVTVSSVSWSLGSGTAVQVNTIRQAGGAGGPSVSIWAIPAPTMGTGTYTVNLSGSIEYQITADLFSGADQNTPCPSGDSVTFSINGSSGAVTLTPTNVGANDAAAGGLANTQAGDALGWTTGTQSFLNDTSNVNFETAYRLGASPIVSVDPGGGQLAGVGVRVQVPAGATSSGRPLPVFDPIPFVAPLRI